MSRRGDERTFTHAELCGIAVKWLQRPHSGGGPNCAIAVSEVAGGYTGEIPDAIGFSLSVPVEGSTVVEVKVTRSDFLADRRKSHRAEGGMGAWRYYMAPEGLIGLHELPEGWGLIEVNRRGHCKVLAGATCDVRNLGYDAMQGQAERWRQIDVSMAREQWLLVKLLARLGDPEKLNQQRREEYRERAGLVNRVNELVTETQELRRDIRWQTRRDRLAEQQASVGDIREKLAIPRQASITA